MPATDQSETPLPAAQKPAAAPSTNRSFPVLRTIGALVLREMAARYGKSPGGFLWAFISPLIMVLVLTAMFSVLARQPRYGDSFLIFFASGHLAFGIFGSIQGSITSALQYNRPLLQYPAVTWIDAILSRFLLGFLIATSVYFVLIYGIVFLDGEGLSLDVPVLFEAVLLAGAVAFGFGVLTQYLFLEVPAIGTAWGFASRPMFIASGVLIMPEQMPSNIQDILYWNPLMHVVAISRSGIFVHYNPTWTSPLYVLTFAATSALIGLILVRKHHDRLLNFNN